jgi:uncharacterized membrane protein YfcA
MSLLFQLIDRMNSGSRFAAFFLGNAAGTVGSLVGMGGSFFALPVLINCFRISNPQQAVGTGMSTVLGTAIGGSLGYMTRSDSFLLEVVAMKDSLNENFKIPERIGDLDLSTAGFLALGSTATVILGAKTTKLLNGRNLRFIVGSFLIAMAPLVPGKTYLKDWIERIRSRNSGKEVVTISSPRLVDENERRFRSFSIGIFSGFLAGNVFLIVTIVAIEDSLFFIFSSLLLGLLGVGGGAIVVPALSLFTDLSYPVALGTSLAAMIPTAVVGSVTHFRQGTMVPRLAIPLGVGSFLGKGSVFHVKTMC